MTSVGTTVNEISTRGLVFEAGPPVGVSSPNRTDIACFVGFVGRRRDPDNVFTPVPVAIQRWLYERQWACSPDPSVTDPDCTSSPYAREPIDRLLDVPVPIESWDAFDALFDWDRRDPVTGRSRGGTYLGAGVRSFFAQGGRHCYVVRVGDPPPDFKVPDEQSRIDNLEKMISGIPGVPGIPGSISDTPLDPSTWHGVGHLFGLPDVAMLCLPDLTHLVSAPLPPVTTPRYEPQTDEVFVDCAAYGGPPQDDTPPTPALSVPRCDKDGYELWGNAIRGITQLISRHAREAVLIASVPIPLPGSKAARDLVGFLTGSTGVLSHKPGSLERGITSAFVQLVYPWVRTPGSTGLPERLESPDAVFTGILAANALRHGTFNNIANQRIGDVSAVYPVLTQHDLTPAPPKTPPGAAPESSPGSSPGSDSGSDGPTDLASRVLSDRVSLFGPTPAGLRVLSDVTTSLKQRYRPGSVTRLVGSILRAARRVGESSVFEPSGPRLWESLRSGMEQVMLGLYNAGALHGGSPQQAFRVRCDRTTMTQNDLDQGRVLATVEFDAAVSISTIRVTLAISEGGGVRVLDQEAEGDRP